MKIFFLFLFCFFLLGCQQNSALSDVELSDPSLITPQITLQKTINENGKEKTKLKVYLNDKNGDGIDLKKGSVKLNKQALNSQTDGSLLSAAPFYTIKNLELINNRKYTFVITLADDKNYTCYINSPKTTFNNLVVPEYHNKNKNLTISWTGKVSSNIKTSHYLKIKNQGVLLQKIALNSDNLKNRKLIVNSRIFNQIKNRAEITITLESKTSGKVDKKFNGGNVNIIYSYSKKITLDDFDDSNEDTDPPEYAFGEQENEQENKAYENEVEIENELKNKTSNKKEDSESGGLFNKLLKLQKWIFSIFSLVLIVGLLSLYKKKKNSSS